MIHLGIDPGAKGGIAIIAPSGKIVTLIAYKPVELIGQLRFYIEDVREELSVTVEKGRAFPGQGVSSMFSYGKGCGVIEGILMALGVPYSLVSANVWHAKILHGADGDTPKARAWSRCQQLFPNHYNSFLSPRGKVLDGLVDAALIAEYSRRSNGR